MRWAALSGSLAAALHMRSQSRERPFDMLRMCDGSASRDEDDDNDEDADEKQNDEDEDEDEEENDDADEDDVRWLSIERRGPFDMLRAGENEVAGGRTSVPGTEIRRSGAEVAAAGLRGTGRRNGVAARSARDSAPADARLLDVFHV